ncbi:unnamed protein product [Rotaria magnacalcarata]|uniref:Uncharacterized protein n=1 Tax=Rotaria magnacalcarata TaxID=392030 RepID=A0A816ZBD6_9BILA|nr:unnamed protein product [Rotaria magnacalcarata]CAF4049290.1 unnamed protein product [Rotaria magnacalcarata]
MTLITLTRSGHIYTLWWIIASLIIIFILRYNILTIFYIFHTYLSWHQFSAGVINSNDDFDTTMSSYPINQTSAMPNHQNVVPAILHHIVIGNIDLNKHPTWTVARAACLKLHPNYEHKFWNDSLAEKFILEEYPWFFEAWKNYNYPIQRADSLRYLILYRYGGFFLDMDLYCRRSLGPLRRFEFVSPAAYPVGLSNGFLMVSARHPFMKLLVEQLPLFNRNFVLPYATVMFSTGCMYISAQYLLYEDRNRLRLLDYKQHRLSGRVSTPLFHHHGSSSWHANDASFIKNSENIIKKLMHHKYLVLFTLLICVMFTFILWNRRRIRRQNEETLLCLNTVVHCVKKT